MSLGASCSNRTVFLNLSGFSSLAASGPLLPIWMSLTLSSSCWVFSDVTARCVRMSDRHLLITSVPDSIGTSPAPCATRFFSLFDSLCLSDSVFIRIHPCFSRQGPLNDRSDSLSLSLHSSLCGCVAFPCDASAAHPGQPPVSFNVRRQSVESSGFSFWCSFNHNPLQWGSRSSFVSCETFSVNLNSGATMCHGVPHKPSQLVDSQAYRLVSVSSNFCLAQLHSW